MRSGTVRKFICGYCEKSHILAIIKHDEAIKEKDILCTDKIESYYDDSWCEKSDKQKWSSDQLE